MTDPIEMPREHAGVYVPPPLLYVVVFAAAMFVDRVKPLPLARSTPLVVAGIAVIAAAFALAAWSIGCFWRQGTSIVPIRASKAFVVAGPYRFSRNPMYLSLLVAYIGASAIAASLWPLLLLPILVALVDVVVIGPEERYMATRFGEQYNAYAARVRRWI